MLKSPPAIMRIGAQQHVSSSNKCQDCVLRTYNIMAACQACSQFNNSTPPDPDALNVTTLKSWMNGMKETASERKELKSLHLPPWANATVTNNNKFNPSEALRLASDFDFQSSSKSHHNKHNGSTSSGMSNVDASMHGPASHPNAGAIAGGVIGGVVFIALVVVASFIICRCRRNRKRRIPPSRWSGISPSMYGDAVSV
ncbi:hypothetical protein BU17DRAFT_91923 [Hysterangium stoloniferum]|nr:hypothetical protein BU17DRAFT_91923 [Hysterangium stoloniferum]